MALADTQADEVREILHLESAAAIALHRPHDPLTHLIGRKLHDLRENRANAETAHGSRN